ncbi:metal-dependent hydrolase family protein [Amycolatopsis jejuensis]|uniref:metal-dependent hydrolase family protein n=1 Tax=Amycolatopsis jejuensis TaxID=330084 RepID=UPI0005271ACE|nr:amidohydrolase family protein [Amycolatopsis jejuensis]
MTVVRCGQLIDGLGAVMPDAAVTVEDGRITAVEPWTGESSRTVLDYRDRTVMPGLIEAHGHMGLLGPGLQLSAAEIAAHVFANVQQALREGFTTVRDAGGIDGGVAACVNTGLLAGPRILPSGPFITQTGGHADGRPVWHHHHGTTSIPGLVRVALVCDGSDDVRRAVREAFRHGATQIKVCVSGGVSSGGGLDNCQMSVSELQAAVEEAQARHTYVHAHAHSAASIRHAIAAGVRHFEHGSLLDEPTADLMREVGASLVPTLLVLRRLIEENDNADLRALLDSMRRSVKLAHEAGIPLGSGSDLLGMHQRGRAEELVLKAEIIGPMAAIMSATSVSASILGIADRVGSVAPGLDADLLVLDGDPLTDPAVFARPEAITAVLRGGVVTGPAT